MSRLKYTLSLNIPGTLSDEIDKARVFTGSTMTGWILDACRQRLDRCRMPPEPTTTVVESVVETPKPKNKLQWMVDWRKEHGGDALAANAAWRAEHEAPAKPVVDNWLEA